GTMGTSTTDHLTEEQNQIAIVAKALGHPARIEIIEYLLKVNASICNHIVNELPLALATISHHLQVLKNARIIQGEIEGNSICYCINETTFNVLKEYFSRIIFTVTNQKCC